MAIYYFDTKIIKASSGKCAVASAAYQAGEKLYDEKLGKSFAYTNKEEVVHTEILLPENAPEEYLNREKLWNAVEESQNKANSRYARQFIIATPKEWGKEETIERCHEFIQKEFVDKGMACDWALHYKDGNPHIHIMATVRGFNQDGSWAQMERKEYARDDEGNKIPEIDPKTGEQKVRERNRDGRHTIEKIWKRITVQSNTWNSRAQLLEWRQAWSEYANRFLQPEEQIDHRSYAEQGIDKVAQIHEGYAARMISNRGGYSDRVEMNAQIQQVNTTFDKIRQWIEEAKQMLIDLKDRLLGRGLTYEYGASKTETESNATNYNIGGRIPTLNARSDAGTGTLRPQLVDGAGADATATITDTAIAESHSRISGIRERLSSLIERNRALITAIGDVATRKLSIEGITNRIEQIKEERRQAHERADLIRRSLLGDLGGTTNTDVTGRTIDTTIKESERTAKTDTKSTNTDSESVFRGRNTDSESYRTDGELQITAERDSESIIREARTVADRIRANFSVTGTGAGAGDIKAESERLERDTKSQEAVKEATRRVRH